MPVAQSALSQSLERAWPTFVLVAALLLLGAVAAEGGLFRWAGAWLERLPGPPVVLAAASLALVAAVTAVLNLDTAVVFVTPVLVHAARRRGLDPRPLAYGALVMANASSLLLPGANLTNLLVRDGGEARGWLRDLGPTAVAVALTTAVLLLLLDRGAWRTDRPGPRVGAPCRGVQVPPPAAVAAAATAAAALAIVLLPSPALPVLAVAVTAALADARRGRSDPATWLRAVGPATLAALFALVVACGWLARSWDGPARLLDGAGPAATAAIAAVASVLANNLPATALLSARPPAHPEALLLGLNVGPNLFVTGSLAAWLWWRTCRAAGVEVRLGGLVARGPITAVVAMAAGLLALAA